MTETNDTSRWVRSWGASPQAAHDGLGSLTVFKDSRVKVTDVGSKPGPDGFTLTASGRLAN